MFSEVIKGKHELDMNATDMVDAYVVADCKSVYDALQKDSRVQRQRIGSWRNQKVGF